MLAVELVMFFESKATVLFTYVLSAVLVLNPALSFSKVASYVLFSSRRWLHQFRSGAALDCSQMFKHAHLALLVHLALYSSQAGF